MALGRIFQIKWYHLLFGFLAVLLVALGLAWLFLSKEGVSGFVEDETDIVE